MNCTFYRPTEVNIEEFENILGKLAYDLHLLETEPQDEWSVYTYFYGLSRKAQPLKKNPEMSFFGFADPETMPSDARVDYFYRPTYLATAFMIKAVLMYPSMMSKTTFLDSEFDFTVDTVRETLKACMLGCTGRNFDGAGALSPKSCVEIFENAGATEFIENYPEVCPQFNKLFKEAKAYVKSGAVDARENWYNHFC